MDRYPLARPTMQRSWLDQRVAIHRAAAPASRFRLALLAETSPGRRAGWFALATIGLGLDVARHRWLLDESVAHRPARTALDVAEATAWAFTGTRSPASAKGVEHLTVVPAALEAGYRLGAGDQAVPVVLPVRTFPPAPRDLARTIGETLLPVVLPHLAMRLVRHRRRQDWSTYGYVRGALSLASGFGVARHRDLVHRRARREWAGRARHHVALEGQAAAVRAAVRPSLGHDFKKVLTALAVAGSEPARQASSQQMAHPAAVVDRTTGTTIFRAALGVPVIPIERRDVWIGDDQRLVLDEFIEEIDDELEATDPQPLLEVDEVTGLRIQLRYRGRLLTLTNPAPEVEAILDPVPVSLVASAAQKCFALLQPELEAPKAAVLVSAFIDVAAAVAYGLPSSGDRGQKLAPAVVAATASTVGYGLAVSSSRLGGTDRTGAHANVVTDPTAALLIIIAAHRAELSPLLARTAIGLAVGGWATALVTGHHVDQRALLGEAILLGQVYAGARGVDGVVAAETEALEDALQEQFRHQVARARIEAVRAELDRYRHQVDLAERELVVFEQDLDPALASYLRRQCEEVRQWIDDPKTETELAS